MDGFKKIIRLLQNKRVAIKALRRFIFFATTEPILADTYKITPT